MTVDCKTGDDAETKPACRYFVSACFYLYLCSITSTVPGVVLPKIKSLTATELGLPKLFKMPPRTDISSQNVVGNSDFGLPTFA